MKIYDDAIPEKSQENLENLLLGSHFQWHLNSGTILEEKDRNGFSDTQQFTHKFISEKKFLSPYLDYVMSNLNWSYLVEKILLPQYIIRMKANLLLSTKNDVNPPHVDLDLPHTVMIYYVSDSDGPTVFFKKEDNKFVEVQKVDAKKGRILVFDGSEYHASTPPKKNSPRCVLNFNLTDHD